MNKLFLIRRLKKIIVITLITRIHVSVVYSLET